jgi:hypothetical protein
MCNHIPFYSMLASWAGVFCTLAAVCVAIWLPRMQAKKFNKESKQSAYKLISAQLIVVKDNVEVHQTAMKISKGVLDNPIVQIEFLPENVQSFIEISKLTLLYKLISEIRMAEQARQKYFEYRHLKDDGNTVLQNNAYSGFVKKINQDIEQAILEFKS